MNTSIESMHVHCNEIFHEAVETNRPIKIPSKFLIVCGLIFMLIGVFFYVIACVKIAELSDL